MALTKWSALWGGPIPVDPTFWGGNVPVLPPDPEESGPGISETRVAYSALWLANDRPPSTEFEKIKGLRGGDTMGWVPGQTAGLFELPGDVTLVLVRTEESSGNDQSFNLVRSDQDGSVELQQSGAGESILEQVHAEPYASELATGVPGNQPAFSFLGPRPGANPLLPWEIWSLPLADLTTVPVKLDPFWDNELETDTSQARMVSLPRHGTVLVIQFEDFFYLKPVFGSGGSSAAATKILLDPKPDESWTLDPLRYHVTSANDGTLIFYCGLRNAGSDTTATSVMAYNPLHSTFDEDTLPYNEEGVVHRPTIFVDGLMPTVSHKGAARHAVSGDVLVALEETDSLGVAVGHQLHWATSRGLGIVKDPVDDVWDEESHPHIYGGVLDNSLPNRTILMQTVNWTGGRQDGSFQVVGSLELGEPGAGQFTGFNNKYSTVTGSGETELRMLLGSVHVVSTDQTNVGGEHNVSVVRTVAMLSNEAERQGYDATRNPLSAVILARLDEFKLADSSTELEIGSGSAFVGPSIWATRGYIDASFNFTNTGSNGFMSIDASPDYQGDSVCVSIWAWLDVLPGEVADEGLFTIAQQPGTAGDDAWRLSWTQELDLTGGHFHFRIKTDLGGVQFIVQAAKMKFRRWYHVTALYNDSTELMQLYVFGVLIAEASVAAGAVIDHAATPQDITLGYPLGSVNHTGISGYLDDFALGKTPVAHQQVLWSFLNATVSPAGPVRTSRSVGDVTLQDHVYSTATITLASAERTIITVGARQCNFSVASGFDSHVVFDVWKLDGTKNNNPQYMGILSPPPKAMDRVSSDAAGSFILAGTTITSFPVDSDSPPIDFDIKLVRDRDGAGSFTGSLRLYILLGSDQAEGGIDKSAIYYIRFDPNDPATSALDPASYVDVMEFVVPDQATAWSVTDRTSGVDATVAFVIQAGLPLTPDFWVMGESKYGGTSPSVKTLSGVLPVTTGSFQGYNYFTAFASTDAGPSARGMVLREIEEDQGWTDDMYGDIQIIFGLASNTGGTEIPASGSTHQLVGTLGWVIPAEAADTVIGGDFPLAEPDLRAVQLDEYGEGGIDPFIPQAWVNNLHEPQGSGLLIGVSGNRSTVIPGAEGQNGVTVYKVGRGGIWGVRPLFSPGPSWGSSQNGCVGISAFITGQSSPTTDNPPSDILMVCRPCTDRTDRFSSTIFSDLEAADAGYWFTTEGLNSTWRRCDRNSGMMWMGTEFNTQGWTTRDTGAVIKRGTQRRASVTLRWSYPGRVTE